MERVVATTIDITELKDTMEALHHSENYYRAIFETSGSAMFIIEDDTTISLVNSNFEELSGYGSQDMEGKKSWTDFVHPDDVEWMKETHYLRRQDPDAVPRQYEFRFLTRREEERNVLLAVDMIPGTNRSIASCIDITQRKQMEEKLKEMSFRDSLTGLYNRNFFEEEMTRLSDRRYNPIGIVVCDLDGLKFVNDTLGHQSGDQMLIQTADILRQNFRSSDIIARIGGDEFAVQLTETNPEIVEQILRRLRQAVQDHNNVEPGLPLSLSIGYALDEGRTADMYALFREADNRMYREKIQREGSARSAILNALTVSMEARDFNTENHCSRMQELAASVARALNLSHDFVNDLYLLARFHDLGKVGIPDHILFKPGPLTEEEWQQMRQHCEIGHRIASSVPDLEPIADFILKHHERWDGHGYPIGLSGEDIPLACRILAIADAYDAMISDRPYRKAMSQEEAIAELRCCSGAQFDPELVEKFIEIIQEAGGG
jgi:diguanylate cyclase (GGDEF)-like protein/PAS domain S-box-containing protein